MPEKLLRDAERVVACISGAVMILVMCIVVSDVIMRYVFNMPWPWAYDVITLYFMVAIFYLGFPLANTQRANISVDLLVHYFNPRFRHVVELLSGVIAFVVFLSIGWIINENLVKEIETNELLPGYYDYPTFIASLMMVTGSVLMCLRSLMQVGLHGASAYSGKDYIALPKLPGEE